MKTSVKTVVFLSACMGLMVACTSNGADLLASVTAGTWGPDVERSASEPVSEPARRVKKKKSAKPAPNPLKNAYFGQTHQHTSWSFDAYVFGNTTTGPDDAYKYAQGKTIKHPVGYDMTIKKPLDFMALTDHSEYMGTVRLANTPGSDLSKQPIAQKLIVKQPSDVDKIYLWFAKGLLLGEPIKELNNPKITSPVWKQIVRIADKNYKPGKFTTFAAYEWTSNPNYQNMHRNIIFLDTKKVPDVIYSSLDSYYPSDLWTWMDKQRKAGHELLAISHNGNLSNGVMFPVDVDLKGRAIDAAWAKQRMRNEPLIEIKQLKGSSETHPTLSPTDEFANFELLAVKLGGGGKPSQVNGSYARQAYQNGLAMQNNRGYNPYKFGLIAAGDSHNTVVGYSNDNFTGGHGKLDGTPEARLADKKVGGGTMYPGNLGTSGLAGVWAEENTRESLFAAMQRKETFATSGTHLKLRMFGGWDFDPQMMDGKGWVKIGYAKGVPMGSDLAAKKGTAPSFAVWAVKDPDDANLDRIQIIKGWSNNGQTFERIYDVAWSGDRKPDPKTGKVPAVGNTVDVVNVTYENSIGATELKAVWTDPDFDPSLNAFYYARAIQIPTPRWTLYDAKKLGVPVPEKFASINQERAWGSPIWYNPVKPAVPGLTVAELEKKGLKPLDQLEVNRLILGKAVTVRNTVTGDTYEILYGNDGRRMIQARNGVGSSAEELGHSLHSGEVYTVNPDNGRLSTMLDGVKYELSIYKQGKKYIGARSDEFGFANYEIVAIK